MNERPGLLVTKCPFTGDQNQMSWWGNYFDPHFAFESPLIYWSFYLSECPTRLRRRCPHHGVKLDIGGNDERLMGPVRKGSPWRRTT